MLFANLPNTKLCHFKKGEYLLRQGDMVEYVYYLVEGTCEGVAVTKSGLETVYYYKGDDTIVNSLVGVLMLFIDKPNITDFVALEDCSCYKIPKKVLLDYLATRPDVLQELVSLAMYSYYEVCEKLQMKQQRNAVSAVTKFFLVKSEQIGKTRILSKHYTENIISKLLGIHPITTAKIIKKLKEEDIIYRTSSGWMINDEARLEVYATGEESLQYRYQKI